MTEYSCMSDTELLENNFADSGKTAELISRYMKTVFSAVDKYSALADREELVSDGMQALLSAIQTYEKEKGDFPSYLFVCIDNKLKNTARRSLRRKSRISQAEQNELEEIADTKPTPEEIVIDRENSDALFRNMRTELTALEFRCMCGVMIGFSYDEIAGLLKIDRKSVDNAVMRARTKLRRFYADKR